MALLDEIKKRLSSQPANQPAGLGAQTSAQKILGAKATGKAAIGPAPQVSNVGGKVAEQQASQQMEDVQQANQMQLGQIEQQEGQMQETFAQAKADLAAKKQDTEAKQAAQWQMGENARMAQQDEAMAKLGAQEQMQLARLSAEYDQQLKRLTSERGIAEDDIFEQFRQGNEELSMREDAAQLEQLAFTMRLRDNQYMDQIERIAKQRNLEDELAFREESLRLRMGNETSLIMDEIGFKEAYNASERDFNEKIKNMDVASAIALSEAMAKDAAQQQMFSGIVSGGTAAAQYGQKQGWFDSEPAPAPTSYTPVTESTTTRTTGVMPKE